MAVTDTVTASASAHAHSLLASEAAAGLFGGVHWGLIGVGLVLSLLVIWAAKQLRGTHRADRVIRAAGWALLAGSLAYTVWMLLPENWHINDSLPLHYSDLLRYITAVALIWRPRWAMGIAYYWGLTLNLQAMLTPHPSMLSADLVTMFFYWSLHIAVLLAPLALLAARIYRPSWRDFFTAYALALAWVAVVIPINAALGTNYGFLNQPPDGASLIDFLGPWPGYVFWLAVLAGLIWATMTLPWYLPRRKHPAPPVSKEGTVD